MISVTRRHCLSWTVESMEQHKMRYRFVLANPELMAIRRFDGNGRVERRYCRKLLVVIIAAYGVALRYIGMS